MSVSGIFGVRKASGPTSQGVLNQVKRSLSERKVGHSGTLDPLASGVMIVGAGKVTRVLRYLVGCDKSYIATMELGRRTDTLDVTGATISLVDASQVTLEDVLEVLPKYRGRISQMPPQYSALKVGGVRAYAIARKGGEVKLSPREVVISELNALYDQQGRIVLSLRCSSGTYVRSLVADIGDELGVGATMSELVRSSLGPVSLEQCQEAEKLSAEDALGISEVLPEVEIVSLEDREMLRSLRNGADLPGALASSDLAAACDAGQNGWDSLVGIYERQEGRYRPSMVFHHDPEASGRKIRGN